MISRQGFAADSFPLQQLANWSSEAGIFLHPDLEFIRGASDYRDYRLKAKDGALLQYLTPLAIFPSSCLIGFSDPGDEAEKKDMMKGTSTAAGVAVENKMEEQEKQQQQQNGGIVKAEDVCKFFFDSLSLLVNDCISAQNNSSSDTRHLFSSILLSGTRTLKNAPYLSDKDFAVVGQACPLAEAFRYMVQNFVDNGPLSGKVERPLLQTAVSLALSHATVLPMKISRSVDNFGNLIRGGMNSTKIESAPGGLGIVPWLHMLPHGGQILNAVAISVSSVDVLDFAKWIHEQVPESGLFFPTSSSSSSRVLKDQFKNGFVFLAAAEDIGPNEEVCTQMMAPLNPVRVAPAAALLTNNNGEKEDRDELLQRQFEMDKEYDETLAMWMVTTASAPSDEDSVPSSEAKFIQSCITEAVENEVAKLRKEK